MPDPKYSPENPYAPKKYRPENPYANGADFSDVTTGASTGKKKKRGSIFQSAAEGVALGFGDEAAGAISALTGGTYDAGKADFQERRKNYKAENPGKSLAAEIGGGIAAAIPAGGASLLRTGAGLGRRVATGALEGGVMGGVAGAGSAEGGLRERSKGFGLGATIGAPLGAALPVVGAAASGIRGAIAPATKKTAESQANRLLRTALERDGVAPSDMARQAESLSGKPAILPDLAGRNTLGLARAAQATPGRAKEDLAQTLDDRAGGQLSRVAQDVENALGFERKDVHQLADDLIKQRKSNAEPLYEAARPIPIDDPEVVSEVASLMQIQVFKDAMKRGMGLAAAERKPIVKGIPLTIGQLDYMKRGLDAVIESRSGDGKSAISRTEAKVYRQRLNELLEMLDDRHPEYGEARATFKGDSEMIEALESGRSFLKEDPRLTSKQIAGMSEGERELYRVGALDSIREAMDKAGDNADLVKRVFGSTYRRDQLKALLGEAAFNDLAQKMGAESLMVRTKEGILGGPATARIGAELADMAGSNIGEIAATGMDVARGNIAGLIGRGASALQRRAQGNVGNVADNLSSKMLTAPGTPQFDELMRLLAESNVKAGRSQARGNITRRALTGTVGGNAGGGR